MLSVLLLLTAGDARAEETAPEPLAADEVAPSPPSVPVPEPAALPVVPPAGLTDPATPIPESFSSPPPSALQSSSKAPSAKGKRIREKDAEGTQAPNRFEADPVIKSKYELNGQLLEVDPD